ncbi:MAG: hypothetical protein H6728_07020 [Myxococcales bacterium]|nr:hypothetical protein [Myxococcales bacterium]
MIRPLKFSLLFLSLVCLGTLSSACSVQPRDCVPITMLPTVVRAKIDQTVSVTTTLSKSCGAETTATFSFGDSAIIRPASQDPAGIVVAAGQDAIKFDIQGIAAGETKLYITMNGITQSVPVVVTVQ